MKKGKGTDKERGGGKRGRVKWEGKNGRQRRANKREAKRARPARKER